MSPTKPRPALIEQHHIGRDIFYTTPLFWDCACEEGYIRTCLEESCLVCGVSVLDAPDARVDEVLYHSGELNERLVSVLEMLTDRVCPDLISIPF